MKEQNFKDKILNFLSTNIFHLFFYSYAFHLLLSLKISCEWYCERVWNCTYCFPIFSTYIKYISLLTIVACSRAPSTLSSARGWRRKIHMRNNKNYLSYAHFASSFIFSSLFVYYIYGMAGDHNKVIFW
jgi:hypothetical protein